MSNILETFFILFDSDTDAVKKGAEEAGKVTDQLEDKVKRTDKAVGMLGEGFRTMVKAAAGSIVAGISAGALIAGSVAQAQQIDMLRQTSERLNVNIGEWHAWSRAVKQFGGDAGSLEGSLRGLNANLSEIALKGTSGISPFLAKLGIRVRDVNGQMKSSIQLLPELAEAFEGLSRQQVEGIGAKLGLDSGTILMLMQGRRAVEENIQKQKELGVVTERQAKIAASYNRQILNTRASFQMFFASVSEYVLPVLEALSRAVEASMNFLQKYSREVLVFSGIVGLALTPVLITAAKAAWGFAAGIWAAVAPFLPFIAVAAAVTLILADLWAYFTGAPSAIGKMIEAFSAAVPAIKQAFSDWGNFALEMIQGVLDAFRRLADFLTLGGFSKVMEGIEVARKFVVNASNTPIGAQSSGAIAAGATNSQSRSTTIGEVNIQTQATDADGISKAVGQSLQDEMNRTLNAYDDGIAG